MLTSTKVLTGEDVGSRVREKERERERERKRERERERKRDREREREHKVLRSTTVITGGGKNLKGEIEKRKC